MRTTTALTNSAWRSWPSLALAVVLGALALSAPLPAEELIFDWPVGLTVDEKLVPGHGWAVMQRYANRHYCIDKNKSPDYGRWVDIANQNQCCEAGANCNDCCNGSYPCRKCYYDFPHIGSWLPVENAGKPQYRVHAGIDLQITNNASSSSGKPVYAAADGTVHCVAQPSALNYPGGAVVIKHTLPDNSTIYTMYGHVTSIDVEKDDTVERGDEIASIHNQGGLSHLHFEVREFGDEPSGTPDCAGRGYTARDVASPASEDYRDPVAFYYDDDHRRDYPVMLRVRNTGRLNVRDAPSASTGAVLETLEASDDVVAIDLQKESGTQRYWYKIQRDEDDDPDTGWVASYYVGSSWGGTIYSNEQDDWNCGLPCEQCILMARHDVLTNYFQWGWNVSCGNLPAVVDDWCNNLDPAACNSVKAGQCAGTCGTGACGDACSDCVLQVRPDVLSNYELWGWDTACWNRPNIVDDWCNNLDPTACNDVKAGQCSSSCGTQGCGNPCDECVLDARPDVLSNYGLWGWDTSCSNYPAIVDDWCTNLDPSACNDVKASACSSTCSAGSCGNDCAECVLTARPDVLSNYGLWGWDTSCSSYPAIVDDWCNNLDPAACNDVKANTCSATCGTTSCGNDCAECVLTARPDVLTNYGLWGWDTSCSSYPAIVDDWCTALDPTACHDVKTGTCNATCAGAPPQPTQVPNGDVENNSSSQFGFIANWGPNGAWAYHSQFPADNNQGLGTSFGYYSAGTTEIVGQVLDERFAPDTTYVFSSWAIGGGNRAGRVPYRIGYAATDGDPTSFVPLATHLYDVTGNTSWTQLAGVSHTTGSTGPELGRQLIVALGSGADGGSSDIWFDDLTVTVGGAPVTPPDPFVPPSNAGIENSPSGQFGFISGWGPHGAWANHSQFAAGNNQSLGARFGYYSAGATETVGQVLANRFEAGTTYTFKSWAIGGGNRTGQVPYQIGYAANDGDLASFVPLATQVIDLTGNTSWLETAGVSHTAGPSGPEIGKQIIVRFGSGADGGSSDIWFDAITVDAQ